MTPRKQVSEPAPLPRYTNVSVEADARDDMRRFAAIASGVCGRRINIGQGTRIAIYCAEHPRTGVMAAARALGYVAGGEQ